MPPLQSLRDKFRTLSLTRSSHQRAESLPVTFLDRISPAIPLETAVEVEQQQQQQQQHRRRRRRRRWPFSHKTKTQAPSTCGHDGDGGDLTSSTVYRLPTEPAAYQLLEVVGRGMTAVVYSARVTMTPTPTTEAEDEKPKRKNSKCVAVKVVDLDALSDEAMDSVLRETRLLAKLRHRGLAPLLSSFVADVPSEASLWLVMPLASTSARDVLDTAYKGRGLPERSSAAIIFSVAEALCYAHSQGVVHRDVKAQNVLLFSRDGEGESDDGSDEDEEGEGEEKEDNGGSETKKQRSTSGLSASSSLSSRPLPRGRARLSDLGSGNANDALLMSNRGGSLNFSRRQSNPLSPALSSSLSPPSSLLGGGGGGGGSSNIGGSGSLVGCGGAGGGGTGSRVSFARTSLSTLPEHEAPKSSRALREQQQRQQKTLSPSPSTRARDARAAAARKLTTYKTFAGSPAWMAPEVVEQGPGGYHGPACDIYSLGALLVELATGQPPMASLPYETLMMEKLHGDAPTLDLTKTSGPYSREAAELAAACMDRDPTKRPTAQEVLSSHWLEHNYYHHDEEEGEGRRRRRLLRRKPHHHRHHHQQQRQQGSNKSTPTTSTKGTRAEAKASASSDVHEKKTKKEAESGSFGGEREGAEEARCSAAAAAAAEEEVGALIEQYREAKLELEERSNKTSCSASTVPWSESPSASSVATSRSSPAPSAQCRRRPCPSTPVVPSVSASAASSSASASALAGAAAWKSASPSSTAAAAAVSSAAEALRQRRQASLPPHALPPLPSPPALQGRGSSGTPFGTPRIVAAAIRRFGSGGGASEPGTPRTAPASVVGGVGIDGGGDAASSTTNEGGAAAGASGVDVDDDEDFELDPAGLWDSSCDPQDVFGPDWARGVLRLQLFPSGVKSRLELSSSSASAAKKEKHSCVGGIKRHARAAVLEPPISELLSEIGEDEEGEEEGEKERLRSFLDSRAVLVTCRGIQTTPPSSSSSPPSLSSAASPSSNSIEASYTRSLTAAFFRVPTQPQPFTLAERGALALPGASAAERAAALAAAREAGHAVVPAGRSAWAGPVYFFTTQRAEVTRPLEKDALAAQLRSEMKLWERQVRELRRRQEEEEEAEKEKASLSPPASPDAAASAFAATAAVAAAEEEEELDAGVVPPLPPTVPISKKRAHSLGSKLLVRLRKNSSGDGREGDGRDENDAAADEDSPPPQRALQACEASSMASEVILSPCEARAEQKRVAAAVAAAAWKGKKKNNKKRENGSFEADTAAAADENDDDEDNDLPLPASLLGATLHIIRTPFAASRLAFLLLKASEVAVNAEEEHRRRQFFREQEEQQQQQQEQRQKGKSKRNNGGKQCQQQHKPTLVLPRVALRLGGDPLNPIPGDDLPPAMTLAAGRRAVGPLYSAKREGDATVASERKFFSSWLVPATELTAAAHGKERCVVSSSVSAEAEDGGGGGVSRNVVRPSCVVGLGCSTKTLDVAALFAGKLPPPSSWYPFIEDLQGAQELAARRAAKEMTKREKKKEDDDGDDAPPLLLETAASMVNLSPEASLPVSPFANVPSGGGGLPSRSGSAS